jgi:hypothetical protein
MLLCQDSADMRLNATAELAWEALEGRLEIRGHLVRVFYYSI